MLSCIWQGTKAAQAFHYADARSLLRLAANARSRQLLHPEPGQIVYYFRRGKGNKCPTYRGPARVLAVEMPESGSDTCAVSIVWLSHAGVLIRAAPEHLRMATPVEVSIETAIRGAAAPPGMAIHRSITGEDNSKYVDLGPVPTQQERIWANELGAPPDITPDVPTPSPADCCNWARPSLVPRPSTMSGWPPARRRAASRRPSPTRTTAWCWMTATTRPNTAPISKP